MKKTKKNSFIVCLLIFLFTIQACYKQEIPPPPALFGSWIVTTFIDSGQRTSLGSFLISASFQGDSIKGNTGQYVYSGFFSVYPQNGLSIKQLTSNQQTLEFLAPKEQYINLLKKMSSYQLSGDTLQLFSITKASSVIMIKKN